MLEELTAPDAAEPSADVHAAPSRVPTTTEDDLPARLAEILQAIGSQTNYTCTVCKMHEGSGRFQQLAQLRKLPDPDEVGKMFGGGEYELRVSWRTQGVKFGRLNSRTVSFLLGDSYDEAAAMARRKASPTDGTELDRVFSLAERMVSLGGRSQMGGNDVALAGALDRLFDRLDRMQERTDARFEKLAETLLAVKTERVDSFGQLREVLSFGKEIGLPMLGQQEPARAPWLEVVDIIAENAGKFLDMMTAAQKSKVAQIKLMSNPQARKIATVGGAAMKDPAKRAEMIAALDAKVGVETTDKILAGLGEKR